MPDSELHTKVAQIARYLPPWEANNEYQPVRGAALAHPDIQHAGIYFRSFGNKRIAIHGGFPRDFYPLPERRPRITVSATRSAKSIANDIVRRFLPAYIPLFDEMQSRAEAYARSIELRNWALKELAGILGVRVSRQHEADRQGEIRHYSRDHVLVEITTSAGDDDVTASLRLDRLPFEVAQRVCEVLADHV